MLSDRLTERAALLGITHRKLEGPDCHPAGAGGDVHPTDLDAIHHLGETVTGHTAEDVAGRGVVAREDQFGGVDPLVSELVELARNRQTIEDFTEAAGLFD